MRQDKKESPTPMETYDDACRRHAEHQGILPALEGLTKLFGEDVQLYQSGGFCMVVEVKAPTTSHPNGYVWVTNDGVPDEPEWVAGYYPEGYDGDDSTYDYRYVDSLGALAEVVQAYRQGRQGKSSLNDN